MALLRRNERYHNSTENRASVTRSSRSESSTKRNIYEKSERAERDSNNNFISSRAVESASFSHTRSSTSSSNRRSSIPVRRRGESPSKAPPESPEKEVEKPAASNDDEETPKLERKVKKRLVRKVKRRNDAIVGQDDRKQIDNGDGSSPSEDEFLENDNPQGSQNHPNISIKSQRPTVTVGKSKPIQITYKPKADDSTKNREARDSDDDDAPTQRRRTRQERPKTLPITLTVKRPAFEPNSVENSDDEDTLTSGGEESDNEKQRTSIRIVSSAKSSDTEDLSRKLRIEAKSTKRVGNKENENQNKKGGNNIRVEREKLTDEHYGQKSRRFIKREPWNAAKVQEDRVTADRTNQVEGAPGKFRTLPRNFKTVRVPIQTQSASPKKGRRDHKRNSLQPNQLRRPSTESFGRSDDQSDAGRTISVGSAQSYDVSPTGQGGTHQCRRGCTHVVEDTVDGPRVVRRSRDKRRQSNPNQILGRTEIQGYKRGRPKSEIIRSASLPRSTGRPRVKSTGFEEFVEISDLQSFNRSKSRTLPSKKKRVTYHEDTKELQAFSETEVLNEEFQRHLEEHQNFTSQHKQVVTPTSEAAKFIEEGSLSKKEQRAQERAKEIRRVSSEEQYSQQVNPIGFKNQKKVKGQRRVEDVRFLQGNQSDREDYRRSDVRGQHVSQLEHREVKVASSKGSVSSESSHNNILQEKQRNDKLETGKQEKVKEQIIEEHIIARRRSQDKKVNVFGDNNREEEAIVKRSQSLPRSSSKQEYQDQKQREFEEFIRNQRNLLLSQLEEREQELRSEVTKSEKVKVEEKKDKVNEEVLRVETVKAESSGRRIEEFLKYPEASKNKRRNKSSNDAESIQRAKQSISEISEVRNKSSEVRTQSLGAKNQRSNYSENSTFLLQDKEQAKVIEESSLEDKEDIIRVYSRGNIIQLSMETVDRDRFEQRQREYEELQKRRSFHEQQQRVVQEDRYRYINNEFEQKNAYYYNQQQYDPSRSPSGHCNNGYNGIMDDNVFDERMDSNTAQITKIKRDQIGGKLDKVHYTICTHYFYPEDHELIVNLHRLGQIKVPRGLSHEDTCIFYNHLYVYEKEEVYAETLAPITPTIKTEVVNLDENVPDDETMSDHSSANQSYNDDTSSQYSSSSRRDRNLFSSLKAQQYYEAKQNRNAEDSLDFGFDSTYETLRRKRKSYTDDEDWNGNRAGSPGSSSGKSDFTFSKPRLLRRSDHFPGVGREVEDDYPRWTPKSPTQPERNYGLSIGLPP